MQQSYVNFELINPLYLMKRRSFINKSSLAALSSPSLANILLNLKLMSNAVANPVESDYKALVCIFLAGGNDSYNMLVPTSGGASGGEYANYANLRSELALPFPGTGGRDEILPLDFRRTGGRSYGIHGAMPNLRTRVGEGNATFLANVGTLAERVSGAAVRSGAAATAGQLPRALFSHNDQQATWQTGLTRAGSPTGWGGRLADRVMSTNPSNAVSMNISLAGNRTLLVGDNAISYTIGEEGAETLTGLASTNIFDIERVRAARAIANGSSEHLLMNSFAREKQLAFDSSEAFSTAFNNVSISADFGSSRFGRELRAVARTIGSSRDLGLRRQIFFVELGGFDHHPELLSNHRRLLGTLDEGLAGFWSALGEVEAQENVVTFTCSDFARTLRSNGGGTDHGWGGHSIVMGGPVRQRIRSEGIRSGSRLYGEYPDQGELAINAGLDGGSNGRMVPTTSTDEYFAELSLWLGLPRNELVDVLPNIESFYRPSSGGTPLGMLPV